MLESHRSVRAHGCARARAPAYVCICARARVPACARLRARLRAFMWVNAPGPGRKEGGQQSTQRVGRRRREMARRELEGETCGRCERGWVAVFGAAEAAGDGEVAKKGCGREVGA